MDYGFNASQKGYDNKSCADRFLVGSSAFGALKVFDVYEVSTTIPTDPDINTITINHNLGYIAPFIIIYNGRSGYEGGTSNAFFFCGIDGYPITHRQTEDNLEIDISQWFDDQEFGSYAGQTVYFTVYVFAEDFSEFDGGVINTGLDSGASDANHGLRISKAGYDVNSCDDKDCVLTSSKASMIVHMKGRAQGVPIYHNLGYIPSSLTYAYSAVDGQLSFTPAFAIYSDRLEFIDSDVLYVIFKDKLN
jgi:hypothetical protein